MKRFFAVVLLAALSSSALADQYVNGYYRKNGTYVQPYVRSSPNGTRSDNYGPSRNPYERQNPYARDNDRDGIPNNLDNDDDNDGVQDDNDSSQY